MRSTLARVMATVRAWRGSHSMPSYAHRRLDDAERMDRNALGRYAAQLGPIFDGVIQDRRAVCVVGNTLGRKLLSTHSSSLRPVSIDVSDLFPGEFMRGMEGKTHRHYRGALIRGLSALDLEALMPVLRQMIRQRLLTYALASEAPTSAAEAYHNWSDALSEITSGLLIRLVFGVELATPACERLMAAYQSLGPNGVAWTVREPQRLAFARLREELSRVVPETMPLGLMPTLAASGPLDATMLGNLIYMVETGRYDLRGLMRWISKFAAEHPHWLARIAAAPPTEAKACSEAFVLEVLRQEQSERLMRDVLEDFTFEGFFFAKGDLLRICMWEAHKDADTFERPFVFDSDRFLGGQTYGERFSPFGLDHHLCPFSSIAVRLASLFLTVLAEDFELTAAGGNPPVRGPYHWEPAGLSVSLRQKGRPVT